MKIERFKKPARTSGRVIDGIDLRDEPSTTSSSSSYVMSSARMDRSSQTETYFGLKIA